MCGPAVDGLPVVDERELGLLDLRGLVRLEVDGNVPSLPVADEREIALR